MRSTSERASKAPAMRESSQEGRRAGRLDATMPGARTLPPKERAREAGSLPGASCLLVGHAHGLADLRQGGLR